MYKKRLYDNNPNHINCEEIEQLNYIKNPPFDNNINKNLMMYHTLMAGKLKLN